jgi:hypothetical protein
MGGGSASADSRSDIAVRSRLPLVFRVIGGADSGDELSTMDWILITDESRPVVQLVQDSIGCERSTDYNGSGAHVGKLPSVSTRLESPTTAISTFSS